MSVISRTSNTFSARIFRKTRYSQRGWPYIRVNTLFFFTGTSLPCRPTQTHTSSEVPPSAKASEEKNPVNMRRKLLKSHPVTHWPRSIKRKAMEWHSRHWRPFTLRFNLFSKEWSIICLTSCSEYERRQREEV